MDIIGLEPMTEVHLLKGVPLDNTYQHTLTFADKTTQYAYFRGKAKTGASFTDLTPVNLNNAIQLPINAYAIFDCNYIMFKNANFTAKWLYAFITDIQYISVNCCKVSIELDLMQTWYFDYTWKESFVVREHVVNDAIGANLVDEGLDTGEYVRSEWATTGKLDYFQIAVAISYDKDLYNSDPVKYANLGNLYSGVYSGLRYLFYNRDDEGVNKVNSLIQTLADLGKSSMIVSIFMFPLAFINGDKFEPSVYDISPVNRPTTFQGYTPKNNKLHTYPYSYVYVSNNNGGCAVYRYEYMSDKENPAFKLIADMSPNPSIYLMPTNYKDMTTNAEEKLILTDFPQCSWNNDVYANWLAQNTNTMVLGALTSVAGGAMGVASATASAASKTASVVSGASGILGQLAQIADRAIQPYQAAGSFTGGSLLACKLQDFFFYSTTITNEYAKRIDKFFELYGYKVNNIKVPEINSRPYWNYVQTMGANIVGEIPFNDISRIKGIFDNGITFWHGDYVGNYSLNNH